MPSCTISAVHPCHQGAILFPFSGRETIRKDKVTCEPQPLFAQTICLTPLLQIYLYVFNGKGLGSSLQLLIWSIRSRELKITITKIGLTQDPINDRESLTWDSFFPKPFTYSWLSKWLKERPNRDWPIIIVFAYIVPSKNIKLSFVFCIACPS